MMAENGLSPNTAPLKGGPEGQWKREVFPVDIPLSDTCGYTPYMQGEIAYGTVMHRLLGSQRALLIGQGPERSTGRG